MPYESRPRLEPLPEFVGTARPGLCAPPGLVEFVLTAYGAGRSLREIAELTDRTYGAVRNILDRAGVARRPAGAPRLAMGERIQRFNAG